MTKLRSVFRNRKILLAAFPTVALVLLGCNLSKFLPSGNTSSNTVTSDKETSDTSASISTLCNNGYYPVGSTIVRKYHVAYPKGMLSDREYTESFSDFSEDTFVVNTDFGNIKAHINWRCTPDGLLATQYNNSIDLVKSGASAKVDTVDSNGVTFPPEDRWQAGEKWHAQYHVIETMNGPDGKVMGTGDGTVQQDGEIVGLESVTVPAGSFQAMKAVLKTELEITIKMKGMSMPMKVPFETTAWFAKDTGLVKSVTKMGRAGDTTTELVSSSK
jgi:hypothetical protein